MNKTQFEAEGSKLTVTRLFNAPLSLVWRAWTEADLLDQWWAPKPWKSETSYMDFREGGHRIYAMVGPEGERHWARTDYKTIAIQDHFSGQDAFADEEGNANPAAPIGTFINNFNDQGSQTEVIIVTTYPSEADLQTVIDMGMKEGLTLAYEGLDEVLKNLND